MLTRYTSAVVRQFLLLRSAQSGGSRGREERQELGERRSSAIAISLSSSSRLLSHPCINPRYCRCCFSRRCCCSLPQRVTRTRTFASSTVNKVRATPLRRATCNQHSHMAVRLLACCASPSAYKQRRPLSSRFTRSKRSPRSPQERPCSLGGTLRCVRDTRGNGDARWWRALTARPSCRSRGLQRHCAHRGLLPQPAAGVWRHVLNVRLHDLPAA